MIPSCGGRVVVAGGADLDVADGLGAEGVEGGDGGGRVLDPVDVVDLRCRSGGPAGEVLFEPEVLRARRFEGMVELPLPSQHAGARLPPRGGCLVRRGGHTARCNGASIEIIRVTAARERRSTGSSSRVGTGRGGFCRSCYRASRRGTSGRFRARRRRRRSAQRMAGFAGSPPPGPLPRGRPRAAVGT